MDGNTEFTTAFTRMVSGLAVVDSLRRVSRVSLGYAKQVIAAEDSGLIQFLKSTGELQRFIIGIKTPDDLERTGDFLREKLTEQTMKNATWSVDAASLVFAHSILDDGLSSFIWITTSVATEYWKKRIEKKMVELSELQDVPSLDHVVDSLINKEAEKVCRSASLIEKCNLLHAICNPKGGAPRHPEYKFNRDALTKIDRRRQEVVHGELLRSELLELEADLQYLRDTWNYFFVMMHESFGLHIDPSQMSDYSAQRSAAGKPGT